MAVSTDDEAKPDGPAAQSASLSLGLQVSCIRQCHALTALLPRPNTSPYLITTLQIQPAPLTSHFWEEYTRKVSYRQDAMVTLVTMFFLPWVFVRSPDAALAATYLLLLPVKLLHLHLLYRCSKARDPSRRLYSFRSRSAIIVLERVIRITSSYFMSFNYDRQQAKRRAFLAANFDGSTTLGQAMDIVKHLILGTGATVMLWHAFCLTTVWAAEGVLLLPLLLMCLTLRTLPTAHYLAAFPKGSLVHSGKAAVGALCTAACRVALPVPGAEPRLCQLGAVPCGAEAGYEKHLVASLIIFLQFLLPLYVRWVA